MSDFAQNGPVVGTLTPKFGVCSAQSASQTEQCALTENSCDNSKGEVFKAHFETSLDCDDPEKVKVGRCTSSLDDERCSPSEDSCGIKSFLYNRIDTTCSLVMDESSGDKRTTFPACEDVNKKQWQCVLDESSCLDGELFIYSKQTIEMDTSPCHCEDVPTGICYENRTSRGGSDGSETFKLTPQNSFCAVTSRDCPTTHGWMSARDFMNSYRAGYDCRLCKDRSKKPESYPVGACLRSGASSTSFDNASFEKCAMESIDCSTESAGFVSAHRLLRQGIHCPVERTKNWGYCASSGDPVECTNKADSCLYDFRFETNNLDCDIHGNSKTGLPTYFSYCAPRTDNNNRHWTDVRCVWDEWECDPNQERWEEARLPNDSYFQGCVCEDVLTGACQEPSSGAWHCAVSPNGCTDPLSYVPQRKLKERGVDLTCQLCPPRSPTAPPIQSPTLPPVMPPPPTFSPVKLDRPTVHITEDRPTRPTIDWSNSQPTTPLTTAPPIQSPTLPPVMPPPPTFSPVKLDRPTVHITEDRPTRPTTDWSNGQPTTPLTTPPTSKPQNTSIAYKTNNLSTGATIGIAVAGVVGCALVVLVYTLATRGGVEKPQPPDMIPEANEDPDDPEVLSGEPNHTQEMVPASSNIT